MTMTLRLAILLLSAAPARPPLSELARPDRGCDPPAAQSMAFPSELLDTLPLLRESRVPLRAPAALVLEGVTGDVQLEYIVDTTGAVDPCSIRVLRARHPGLTAPAAAYLLGLIFEPGRKGGARVRTRMRETIRFRQRNGDRGRHHVF